MPFDKLGRISLIGLGKLGAPLAAAFAYRGFPTVGVDVDARKVEAINRRVAPIYEPHLQELIHAHGERLRATTDTRDAVLNTDVTFIVVATPSEPHGGFSLRYVLEAGAQIGAALREKRAYHLVVLTSTVMPGSTGGRLLPLLEECSGKKGGVDFGLCYSPEFIALGSVIRDFLNPDFVLIGESDPHAGALLESLYQRVCENHPPAARMNFVNAELAKIAVNTFVTTKITFANMLARMCEKLPGADVDTVTRALGLDSRIGRRYLKGAIGYGGPCFPRDNLALAALGRALNTPAVLAEATDAFNRQQVPWLTALVKSHLPPGGRVGILGLAYKPDSDVVEESQGLLLAQALIGDGIEVIAYDPAAIENARNVLTFKRANVTVPGHPSTVSITFALSAEECVRQADVVVLATPWDEFKRLPAAQFARHSPPRVVIDCWRLLAPDRFDRDVRYVPLGLGNSLSRFNV